QRLESGELEHQANYWTRYLDRKTPVAHLPYDYDDENPGTDAETEPPKIYQFKLSRPLTAKLKETASRENTTLFTTTMAILKTWLAIMTNQTIITVGTIFSGRTYPALEKIPGIMMNLMPVRLDLTGNPDCRQVLTRTKEAILETYNNQDYPLDLVAHKMRKVIDINRDIYSIMLIGQEALEATVHFDGI
ncbi:MAG: hypothetical protein GY940_41535, partial [bacterium]|nr:hypothetical protein [bacterium]